MNSGTSEVLNSNMPPVRAITMDLDNTLWNIDEVLHRAESNSYRLLSKEFPRITQRFELSDILDLRQRIFDEHENIRHDLTAIRIQVFAQLLRSADYEEDHAEYLMERFSVDRNRVILYPDVIPGLESLSELYPLVALSDGNSDLSVIGIRHYFRDCVYAAAVGRMKPHSAGFIKACEAAGASPAETIHIGDHPEYDIEGAQRAGMQTMWIRRNGEKWTLPFKPGYTVQTLHEAVEILC